MSIFSSVEELLAECEKRNAPLWRLVMEYSAHESGIEPQKSWDEMSCRLSAMRDAAASYEPEQRSRSGLSGGDGAKMERYYRSGRSIGGDFTGEILTAAPTAGACGVMPAVLLPYAEKFGCPDERLVEALFVAAGFGAVIATRASISGAEAGCQAEIGSAAAMSAAALVYLHGGSPRQMAQAVAIALKNMMGLVCDPVAGLVEVPCVKRNVAGAMNALSAAELALAGIESRIPTDEVIDAMRAVGEALPSALRETGRGGVAASPTAVAFRENFFGKQA